LEIPFSVETAVFGEIQEVELIPDGKNILVNDHNKVIVRNYTRRCSVAKMDNFLCDPFSI